MSRDVTAALSAWLAAGYEQIGEVRIRRGDGTFELTHYTDEGRDDLIAYSLPEDARDIANLDEKGLFRPLKSAPNLRRGWRLILGDLGSLRRALDYFYPAMLGVLLSHREETLVTVPLRETLGRQSGMYAVTRKITDEQANQLIGDFCRSERGAGGERFPGCLKTILWRISPATPVSSLPPAKFEVEQDQSGTCARALPMLCHEACNLLVAQARERVKKGPPAA